MNTTGKRARLIRQELKLTQTAIAALLDISLSSWQKYEQGDIEIGTKALRALEKQGFNSQWILSGKGSMKGSSVQEKETFAHENKGKESKIIKSTFISIMKEVENKLPERELSKSIQILEDAIEEAFFIAQTAKTPKEIKSAKEIAVKKILFKHS